MSEKPEWFKITEEDEKPIEKSSKKGLLTVFSVALPLVIAGAVAVNANDEKQSGSAPTEEIVTTASTMVSDQSAGLVQTAAVVGNTPVAKSVGVPLPTAPNGGEKDGHDGLRPDHDDDDDFEGFRPDHDDEDDEDDDDDDDHEKRKRHHEGRGTAPTIPQPGTTTTKN